MNDEDYLRYFGKTRAEMIADTSAELKKAAKAGNKEKAKELLALLKRAFVSDDVFWANEVASNLFVAVIMIGLAVIFAIVMVINTLGVFGFDNSRLAAHLAVCVGQLAVGAALQFAFKGEKPWLKYVEMLIICLTVASALAAFGYSAELSLTLPVILSVKYLSDKFTRIIAVVSGVFMLAGSICSVFMSVGIDLNTIALAPGTVLSVQTTLDDAVMLQAPVIGETLKNELLLSFLPNLLQFILISWVCITIAKWGHRTVLEQADVTKEFSRVDTELNMARDIQTNILPHIFPAFPERSEIDIYASMDPAKEVGGDFYDYFLIDNDHLGLVIADVSGKGMPAALFMMIGKTLIKNQTMTGRPPAEVLAAVNGQLCDNNNTGLFITAWVGVLELSTGRLTAANAGHEYPILKQGDGEYKILKDKHGFVLGGMEGTRYREYEVSLQPGDRLFVYTDGVTEATDAGQHLFGMERLIGALNRCSAENEEEVLNGVRNAVDIFVSGAPQFDDLTMLGLTYYGADRQDSTESSMRSV